MEEIAVKKKEILEKLKALCASDDIEAVNTEVNDLIQDFLEALEVEKQSKIKEALEKEEALTAEEEEVIDEDYQAFKIITEAFKEKKSSFFKRRKEEEEKNLAEKKALMEQLKAMIQDEENIGKAFTKVNEIRDKWNSIGSVGRGREQEVQTTYSKLMEEFYYNINIYKEIKEHDLKRNQQLKEEVIEKMKLLLMEENIKNVEIQLRELQNDWENIGGTHQEKWEALKTAYWDTLKSLYEKIKDHYEGRKRLMEQNLNLKKDLFIKTEALLVELPNHHKDWESITKSLIEIQDAWKQIGPAPRKENNELWKSFRSLCDTFFEAKQVFYESRNKEFTGVKSQKEELINKVDALKNSSDWKEAANEIIRIQNQWKKIGSAGPKFEQRLWKRYRDACDFFFSRREEHFAKLALEEDENLKKKEVFIAELAALKLPIEGEEAVEIIQQKTKEFQSMGNVPRKQSDRIYKAFKEVIQKQYDGLNIDKSKKDKILFKSKVETLKSAPDASNKIAKEQDRLRRQVKFIQDEIIQYENNLGFFSNNSKGAEKLIAEVQEKIDSRKNQIEDLKSKLKMLRS